MEGTDRQRIEDLEADAVRSQARITELEGEAVERDARIATLDNLAVLREGRIAALVEEIEHLNARAEHRSVIEQAKGVIMSTMQCSADAAFAVLVAQSQAENRKLRDIAAELAALQDRAGSDEVSPA